MQNKARGRAWKWLLILPFIAVFCVPFYNTLEPALFGFPFFYWFQLLLVLVCAGLIAVVYFMTKTGR